MKLVVGAHDLDGGVIVSAVAFDEWDAAEASRTFTSRVAPIDPPAPSPRGAAELAGVLQLLREHALEPELIVIDGPVHLDAAETPAWGRHLFDALGGRSAVVGISTRSMPSLPAQFEVWRDEEARPLIVTCIGIDLGAAKVRVRAMHGRKRVPTLMKLAARLARGGAA
ncbi:MAG: endonuclease V [Burkholderiales bacterium]|nr:endonuclease V [Burkholderiales bacterium]MDE1925814.1 endonuclease V [Burkholderiales bacterium]MDE2160982.1 endonuclease V [Burkholderiales bacterium]MDE2503167.1 endonuclease V [Burkholderiales bacterium]